MNEGRVFTFVKRDDGVEIIEQQRTLEDLSEIAGKVNTGVRSGMVYHHLDNGTKIQRTVISPNGYLAAHAAPTTACIYLLNGSGEMGNVDMEGRLINKIEFEAGDMLIFEAPMPLHYYRAGPDGAEYLAIIFSEQSLKPKLSDL